MEQAPANETTTKLPNPKRILLKRLSEDVAKLVEQGEFENINSALIGKLYLNDENTDFKTYKQWAKDGYQVRKGSNAFLVWGKPKEKQKPEEQTTPEDENTKDKFFPLCFLFSNAQVDKK